MSNKEQFAGLFEHVDTERAKEHSVLQGAIAELRSIGNPALRFLVAEHLVHEAYKVSRDSTAELMQRIREDQSSES